jgi:indolepyruvate decarboxylase
MKDFEYRRVGRPQMKRITVAEHLFMHIKNAGVQRIFGVPGDFSLGMLDILDRTRILDWTGCATEVGAAYCADGYARAQGLGVVLTTFGVGELSAAVAISGSTVEDVGVLHIVAAPPLAAFKGRTPLHHSFADGDLLRFKRVAEELHDGVFDATQLEPLDAVRAAIRHWCSTKRTTYLLLPQDSATSSPDVDFSPVFTTQEALAEQADHLIAEFAAAYPRAVLVLGNVAQRHGIESLVPELVKKRHSVAVLPNAKGLVDESEASYIGVYNGKLSPSHVRDQVEGSAGRILVGCTIADTTTGGLSHRFDPKSTLILDAQAISWDDRSVEASIFAAAECWIKVASAPTRALVSRRAARGGHDVNAGLNPLDQESMWMILSQRMPKNGRLFAETGSSHYGALDSPFPADTVFECACLWSAIGYALPAALGASLSESPRRVLAVIGDGAAQMTVNELGLIDRYAANPIFVLVDNRGYTVERVIRGERADYNDVAAWHWPDIPRALGAGSAMTVLCDTVASFASALDNAYADDGRAHFLVVRLGRHDATASLLRMGAFLRAKNGLPSLEEALEKSWSP